MDQYSLSQRFQGALLGATIGATQPIDFQPCLNWLCHQHQPPNLVTDPMTSGQSQTIANMIALLPLWLYTHESWRQRQNHLEQLPHWPKPQTPLNSQFSILNSSPLWLYGEAIAQLLRPTCDPTDLLPNLQTRWQQHANHGAPEFPPPWHNCLTQIHQWQQQRTPLHQVQADLSNCPATQRPIAAALYCFIRSPNDWPIAARIATQFNAPTIGSLLGGLWGAYNGWTRFPITAITPYMAHKTSIPFTQTSQQLIQAWSGTIHTANPNPPIVLGPR
jgi:ADP-ribosylglycohydrolase